MPIGEPGAVQSLVKVTRTGEDGFRERGSRRGPLRAADRRAGLGRDAAGAAHAARRAASRDAAEPLPEIDDPAFAAAFDRFADARVVLLGEASHGTSEFYRARAAITRRLIERHGFTIVAVEADWPDAASIDRYVRHRPRREGEEAAFQRFPTWMWRNTRGRGLHPLAARPQRAAAAPEAMAGFYGLDLYNLSGSIRAVIDYLDDVDPEAARVARERYGCLTPWSRDPAALRPAGDHRGLCAAARSRWSAMLRELHAKRLRYTAEDGDEWLDAAANARLVKNAEAYYRAMYYGAAESWNLRDTHMFETLCQLLEAKGPDAKAVVWAHNSHIGNAAFTEMGQVREELNIGQLVKERFGERGAADRLRHPQRHGRRRRPTGTSRWRSSRCARRSPDSYERLCHDSGVPRFLLDLRDGEHAIDEPLMEPRLERFIGVIYRPETERWSHYSRGDPARPVRRLGLVRRDRGGDAAAGRGGAGRGRACGRLGFSGEIGYG